MGIFGDMKALKNVQKIKKGGTAKLSISQVTGLITNMMDAKSNLPKDKFTEVYKLFNELRDCNTKIEMDMETYCEQAVEIIKKFNKIAPYVKYSGGNEVEFSFLLDDIYKRETTLEKDSHKVTKEDEEDIENLINSSNGVIGRKEAEDFIQVIYTYVTKGKTKSLEKFDSLAKNLIEDDPIASIMKVSFFNGALSANGVINEKEMKEIGDLYQNIVLDKMKDN